MVIGSNTVAAFAARTLADQTNALSSSLARLSSGSRIVSPADDPGGLAVSMKFSAEVARLNAAQINVANALSYNQTQDGYLGTVDNALRRMSELATLATDATKTTADIATYNTEFVELKSTITTALTKKFGEKALFGGVELADKDLNGDSDTVDAADARISTQLTALTSAYTTWVGGNTTGNLTSLRDALADMATEMKQYVESSTTETDYDGTAWTSTYDYWAGVTGKTWVDTTPNPDVTIRDDDSGANPATTSTSIASATQIPLYKQMYNDVLTYVNTYGGGLTVTDASDATGYQMKAADMTVVSNAISTSTDANTISATLASSNASSYVTSLTNLISHVTSTKAYVAGNISRGTSVASQLSTYSTTLSAANSRITDVDVATESAFYARQQILAQTASAMLAQANLIPQIALRLLT
jgi:flagellin